MGGHLMKKLAKGLFFKEEEIVNIRSRATNPKFAHIYKEMQLTADKILEHKNLVFEDDTFGYWYFARNRAMDLAMIALLTGEEKYIEGVKGYIDFLDNQDRNFWQGPEYPNRPRTLNYHGQTLFAGELETAQLTMGLVAVYDWTYGLLDETYRKRIKNLLRNMALPLLKNSTMFQSEKWVMNHLCVISTAMLMSLLVLEDDMDVEEDLQLAKRGLNLWMLKIESDGSYGEAYHYWAYPINCLFLAIWSLKQVRNEALDNAPWLSRTFEWALYHQVGQYKEPDYDKKVAIAVNTYDCPMQFQMEAPETLLFANYYKNPLAQWYMDHYLLTDLAKPKHSLHYVWHECNSLLFALYDESNQKMSPEAFGLPKCRVFHDTGSVFLRDNWSGLSGGDKDIVLQLQSGGGGRSRSHEHFDKNSFSIFAKGEYFVVDPGHSCYRGKIHDTYDRETSSHNTITIDNKNQNLTFAEKGMLHDEVVQHISYNNQAQIVGKNMNEHISYIASDARRSYEPYLKEFLREIWFVDNRYFVFRDRVRIAEEEGTIINGFNFNNRDGMLDLEINKNEVIARRPKADLYMNFFVNEAIDFEQVDGRLHTAYHIYPEQVVEGKPGTVKRLNLIPKDKGILFMDYVYVIYPLIKGDEKPKMHFEDSKLVISESDTIDRFTFGDDKVIYSNNRNVKYIF